MGETTLSSAVGPGEPNVSADVMLVQQLLNEHTGVTGQTLDTDGGFGPKTLAAIVAYQKMVVGMPVPDGVISPDGPTFASLTAASGEVADVPALLQPQATPPSVLADADYAAAAAALGCEVAAIMAVASVETGVQGAFDGQGRPTILFERHLFHRATGGVYDASNPDISNPVAGGYGLFSEQYPKIVRAAALDLDAALGSASFGMFQILGQNHVAAGFGDVETYVAAMRTGVGAHLQAFVGFIGASPGLVAAIQGKDWSKFAAGYNGKDYAAHGYDTQLASAYAAAS
jgi:hypothetical protein